jgi:DNA gyrase/topoisomerase IV subunit A
MQKITMEMPGETDKKQLILKATTTNTEKAWVFPTRVPNLLINGFPATRSVWRQYAAHNIGEVCDASCLDRQSRTAALGTLQYITGPIFTGGYILEPIGIKDYFETAGAGWSAGKLKSKTLPNDAEYHHFAPYPPPPGDHYPSYRRMVELVRKRRSKASDIRDESGRDGMRV